ncbi:MAG TPA: DUF4424 family protein [Rhizomicrobium sp.]|jgi:hypothetical protein
MHTYRGALLAGAALLVASQALADDSSAALGAGGVVLTQSADIRMAKEDLYVSPDKVRIHFEFANDSRKDIDTVVAFPLPDIDSAKYYVEPLGEMTDDPVNFVGFSVIADGKRIAPQVEQRAYLKGRDVTATLNALHVPVNVISQTNIQIFDKLSPAQVKGLAKAGLADNSSGEARPTWLIRTKFFWTQKFPAGKTVVLEHSYQPITGGTFYVDSDIKGGSSDPYDRHWNRNYCIDSAALKTIAARIAPKDAKGDDGGTLEAKTTDYILMSGNNWKGPIGHFHLTLDKLKPANILSLCWDGPLKKSGATTFSFDAADYAPTRDIHMLVLSDIPKNP